MATKPFSALPKALGRISADIEKGVTRLMRAMAISAGAKAVDATRVDTGLARSNWRATLGSPASGTIPPYAPGNKLGQGERANATAATAQHRVTIKTFDVKSNKSIFITNNVSYIGILNDRGPNPGNMAALGAQAAVITARGMRVLRC
jgi:hypothetical protein